MRVCGRAIRPSTLAERRLLLAAGVTHIRVPRSKNPYAVARRLPRLANSGDVAELRNLANLTDRPQRPFPNPLPSPLPDEPWPVHA